MRYSRDKQTSYSNQDVHAGMGLIQPYTFVGSKSIKTRVMSENSQKTTMQDNKRQRETEMGGERERERKREKERE